VCARARVQNVFMCVSVIPLALFLANRCPPPSQKEEDDDDSDSDESEPILAKEKKSVQRSAAPGSGAATSITSKVVKAPAPQIVERIVEKEVLVDKVIEVRAQEEGRVLILRAWEGRMRHDVYVRRMCVCPCILFMAWYASIHTRIRKRTYVYAQKCMSVYLFIHVCTCDACTSLNLYTYMDTKICIHMSTQKCRSLYLQKYVPLYLRRHVYTCEACVHALKSACLCVCLYSYAFVSAYACVYV